VQRTGMRLATVFPCASCYKRTMLALLLVVAALLEVGGDAAVRRGMTSPSTTWIVAGLAMLGAYGCVVNANRALEFGRLMGLYIVVFFVVSQVLGAAMFANRPSPSLLCGGALIVAGGVVIQLGTR
jgi:drug/metabolite transporter superfamily protein YnfA